MSEHKIAYRYGSYVCTADDCDFDTTLVWAAEEHVIEENDLDPDEVATDAPTEMLKSGGDDG